MTRNTTIWIVLFVAVNCGFHLSGGTNPASRFSLLAALTEDGSYRIDHYKNVSIDWARTPDGHYYSNKAPGPALLGWPVFWAVDTLLTGGMETRSERDAYRIRYKARYLKVLAWLLQVFPFAFLLWLLADTLRQRGASDRAIDVALIALAFGNTASLMMNTYYGHGMAALWVGAAAVAALRSRWGWVGWSLGWALLSDYSTALLFPGFAYLVWKHHGRVGPLLLGAALPATLWIHYHVACFGSPFLLPNAFQNPRFQDTLNSGWNLWGIFHVPPPWVLAALVFGPSRGLLWTQPWVLGLVAFGYRRKEHALCVAALSGLAGLLFMNAAFGAWWGGLTPGPRYLSAVFPLFAIWLGLVWDGWGEGVKRLMAVGLGVSVLFFLLVFSTHLSAPPGEGLWSHYAGALLTPTPTRLLRVVLLLGLAVGASWKAWGRPRQGAHRDH